MKIAVFSDSHRHMSAMENAVALEKPDVIFHLGDHDTDAAALSRKFRDIPLYSVQGNCDYYPIGEERIITRIAGKTFFAAHGHTYNVKLGYDSIINAAAVSGADILLFGHTHIPYEAEVNGLIVLNPGSIGFGLTYDIIEIDASSVRFERKLSVR